MTGGPFSTIDSTVPVFERKFSALLVLPCREGMGTNNNN